MVKTSNDYQKAVRDHYEIEKGKRYSVFLTDPSPAKLRDYCLLLLELGMSVADQHQLALFFKPKSDETLYKCISGCDTDKLKAIRDFLIGKTQQTNSVNLELIAVMVHYQPRPLHKFLRGFETEKEVEQEEDFNVIEEENLLLPQHQERRLAPPSAKLKSKWIVLSLLLITIVSVGYVAKDVCFPEKQCMQWQEDHYEIVDCEVQGFIEISPVIALDKNVVGLKRVTLRKDMEFFKYKRPLYYYYKPSRDSVEFFNGPGYHPITKKPLNEITRHMIDKYVR